MMKEMKMVEMDGKKLKRQQALHKVEKNLQLLEAYQKEKDSIDDIIDLALDYPSGANRWLAYGMLKRQASLIVGYDALRPELSSAEHYTVLIDFIDYLLPETAEESDIPQLSKYVDPHELAAWHERADMIYERHRSQHSMLISEMSDRHAILELFCNQRLYGKRNDRYIWED